MDNGCFVVNEGGSGEIVEKKSRFISHIFFVETEEEAISHINAMKKKYYDARHNCYAYSIWENRSIEKASDDGEPSGTAGRPILEVIHGQNVVNVLVVVTRYFGGTLLGTGGLVRAYTDSTVEGFKNCSLLEKKQGYHLSVTVDYATAETVKYFCSQNDVNCKNIEYSENVKLFYDVGSEIKDFVIENITELTSSKAVIDISDETWIFVS